MDEIAGRSFLQRVGQVVEDAIVGHEDRMHIPPPRRGRVTAIPFPNIQISDIQTCRAIEMLSTGATLQEAAETVGAPIPALERALVEYQPAWRRFLEERSAT